MVEKIVVLGTGGTIAGLAASSTENLAYVAGQVGIAPLLDGVPRLKTLMDGRLLVSEQVAQIDSKDMSFAVWQQLVLRINFYMAQPDVKGIVITHGTDTLEETAYFLHAVLLLSDLARKPVVLTCAMRPASSAHPDGPQNLFDAVTVALTSGACGVVTVCAGILHSGLEVQKVHPSRLDAFSSGEAGPLGYFEEEGGVRLVRNWPCSSMDAAAPALKNIANFSALPRVEIVTNYAGASGFMVDALIQQNDLRQPGVPPLRGLVVAATGNGTIHNDLESALKRAQRAGVEVVVATRCCLGHILPKPGNAFRDSEGLSPVKARVALMLALLA